MFLLEPTRSIPIGISNPTNLYLTKQKHQVGQYVPKKTWCLRSLIHVHSTCSCASSRFFCFSSIHFFRKIPGFHQCGWFQNPWNSGSISSQKTNSFDKQSPCSIHKSMTHAIFLGFIHVYPHFLVVFYLLFFAMLKRWFFCHVTLW